jgi:hypothetical protein
MIDVNADRIATSNLDAIFAELLPKRRTATNLNLIHRLSKRC